MGVGDEDGESERDASNDGMLTADTLADPTLW